MPACLSIHTKWDDIKTFSLCPSSTITVALGLNSGWASELRSSKKERSAAAALAASCSKWLSKQSNLPAKCFLKRLIKSVGRSEKISTAAEVLLFCERGEMAPDQSGRFQQISLMHLLTSHFSAHLERRHRETISNGAPRRACSICGRAQNQRARRPLPRHHHLTLR